MIEHGDIKEMLSGVNGRADEVVTAFSRLWPKLVDMKLQFRFDLQGPGLLSIVETVEGNISQAIPRNEAVMYAARA